MEIEVLVATMYQKNLNLYKDMNIKTNVIFANQSNRTNYQEAELDGNKLKMITTAQRGVGKNRNLGLLYSDAEICIFADDDLRYLDNYKDTLEQAFKEIPNADIITFNVDIENTYSKKNKRIKRLFFWNVLNYGAPRIAIRRESIVKKNLWFSLLYGGGSEYSSGEDSLFLIEALNKGLKIYSFPEKIADIKQGQSTWFKGYNEKYFVDKGYWLANAFPKMKYFIALYFGYKLKNKNKEFNILDILKFLLKGIKTYTK